MLAQSGVPAVQISPAFDVPVGRESGLGVDAKAMLLEALDFERGKGGCSGFCV